MKGFTLVEVIVVVFMVALIMLVLSSLFLSENELYRTQTVELNVTADARGALDDIDAWVRTSDRVAPSYSTYTTGSQTLVLQVPSINAQNRIIAATYDYAVFYLNGSGLLRQTFPNVASVRQASTKKAASNVVGLLFSYDNVDLSLVKQVTTDITVQETAGHYTRSITVSSKSRLRNN